MTSTSSSQAAETSRPRRYVRALIATLESIETQMRAAVAKGLDLDAARRVIDVSLFEKEQAGDDPVKRYYFRRYFFDPATQQAFNKARAAGQ